jgi:beta-phosphoglucomutase-like phosphatase (HAD superfamily)
MRARCRANSFMSIVLFDIDGTLTDTMTIGEDCFVDRITKGAFGR